MSSRNESILTWFPCEIELGISNGAKVMLPSLAFKAAATTASFSTGFKEQVE